MIPSIFAPSIKMVGSGLPLPPNLGSSPHRTLSPKGSKRWDKWADLIKKFFFIEPVAIFKLNRGGLATMNRGKTRRRQS